MNFFEMYIVQCISLQTHFDLTKLMESNLFGKTFDNAEEKLKKIIINNYGSLRFIIFLSVNSLLLIFQLSLLFISYPYIFAHVFTVKIMTAECRTHSQS